MPKLRFGGSKYWKLWLAFFWKGHGRTIPSRIRIGFGELKIPKLLVYWSLRSIGVVPLGNFKKLVSRATFRDEMLPRMLIPFPLKTSCNPVFFKQSQRDSILSVSLLSNRRRKPTQ
jgi:hypothetical protein